MLLHQIPYALKNGRPLNDHEREQLLRMLRLIEQGYDPRIELGIRPRPGPPPWADWLYGWLAGHYHLLLKQGSTEKVAALTVADAWGVGLSTLREAAKKHRTEAQAFATKRAANPLAMEHIRFVADWFRKVGT